MYVFRQTPSNKGDGKIRSIQIYIYIYTCVVSDWVYYPLVNIQIAMENGPVKIVDFPIDSMVDLSMAKCDSSPGRVHPIKSH